MSRGTSLSAISATVLAVSLVVTPAFAWKAPPGATPVQDDVDLDDILVDEDLLEGDDDEPELDDEMPAGDGDMPMGDYDLEHGEPEPEPVKPVKPVKPTKVEPVRRPPPEPVKPDTSDRPRRMLLSEDPPPRDDRPRVMVTETEEVGTIGTEEPDDTESDGVVLWTVAGVGAALGVGALVGVGLGAYALLGGFGGPTGTVTITPH